MTAPTRCAAASCIPLWNVYNFFVTYAHLDGWQPATDGLRPATSPRAQRPVSDNLLDRWILARLNQVSAGRGTDVWRTPTSAGATVAVEAFLDDLTNWYVRRSRRRFWKSEHDADKQTAYATLYYVLVTLIQPAGAVHRPL